MDTIGIEHIDGPLIDIVWEDLSFDGFVEIGDGIDIVDLMDQTESLMSGEEHLAISEYFGTPAALSPESFDCIEDLLGQDSLFDSPDSEITSPSSSIDPVLDVLTDEDHASNPFLDMEHVDYYLDSSFNWDDVQREVGTTKCSALSDRSETPRSSCMDLSSPRVKRRSGRPRKNSASRGVKKQLGSMIKQKREQNKKAASKYRSKKKKEEMSKFEAYEEIISRNVRLKKIAEEKEKEVEVLRRLLRDIVGGRY